MYTVQLYLLALLGVGGTACTLYSCTFWHCWELVHGVYTVQLYLLALLRGGVASGNLLAFRLLFCLAVGHIVHHLRPSIVIKKSLNWEKTRL
jgi:hypothetical protein